MGHISANQKKSPCRGLTLGVGSVFISLLHAFNASLQNLRVLYGNLKIGSSTRAFDGSGTRFEASTSHLGCLHFAAIKFKYHSTKGIGRSIAAVNEAILLSSSRGRL
jgi:hypothetical protein